MNTAPSPLAPLSCLVVDDQPLSLDLLTACLKTLGVMQISSAANGSEAFSMLASATRPLDIILSDIQMPHGNGLQLLQAIRTGQIKKIRLDATVVLTTATPTPETIKAASSLDANGYFVKAPMPDKLQAVLLKARRIVFPASPERYALVAIPEV